MEQSLLYWGIALIFGIPLLMLVLGEIAERFEKRGNPLGKFFRATRRYVLPLLAIVLIAYQVFGMTRSQTSVQALETLLGIAAIYALTALIDAVLSVDSKEHRWQVRVPKLVFQFARILVFLGVGYYIIELVWKVDLSNLATALGVGSLVIALALQDTLSSLVSGFLLVFDSPFKVGDWIKYEDIEGQVIDQNWRAVRVETIFWDEVIIPNSALGQAVITNSVKLYPWIWRVLSVRFSYDDPPNRVKQIILRVIRSTEGILADPPPVVAVQSYEDFYIDYYIGYAIGDSDYRLCYDYDDMVMTGIYYAAKRHQLTRPIPTGIEYQLAGHPDRRVDNRQTIGAFMRSLPYFLSIQPEQLDKLVAAARLESYGKGDRVVRIGEPDDGLYIIFSGSLQLYVLDRHNRQQPVSQLSQGDIFGEMALLPGEVSPVTGQALEDLEAIVIAPEAISSLLEGSSRFALEMNQFIEERKRIVRLAQGIEEAGMAFENMSPSRSPILQQLSQATEGGTSS